MYDIAVVQASCATDFFLLSEEGPIEGMATVAFHPENSGFPRSKDRGRISAHDHDIPRVGDLGWPADGVDLLDAFPAKRDEERVAAVGRPWPATTTLAVSARRTSPAQLLRGQNC
jgi:hypothetical protein